MSTRIRLDLIGQGTDGHAVPCSHGNDTTQQKLQLSLHIWHSPDPRDKNSAPAGKCKTYYYLVLGASKAAVIKEIAADAPAARHTLQPKSARLAQPSGI